MSKMQLHVTLDPNIEGSSDVYVYEDNLEQFYQDLIMGRPYPLTLGVRAIKGPVTLLAIALWLYRDLLIHPNTLGLVCSFILVEKHPVWGHAHIERDVSRFIRLLQRYSVTTQERLVTAVEWVRQYVLGTFEGLPPDSAQPIVLDVGTNGFVLAKTTGGLEVGWIELYRQGHLRGLLIGADNGSYRQVLIARKSPWVSFNLDMAEQAFNAMEVAQGGLFGWRVDGDFLWCPPEGTGILVQQLMQVLLRI